MKRFAPIGFVATLLVLSGCATEAPEVGSIKTAVLKLDAEFGDDRALAADLPDHPWAIRAGQPRFVDEYPSFGWEGAPEWAGALHASRGWFGITDRTMAVLAFRHVSIDSIRSSVVVTARLDTKQNGKSVHETGTQILLMTQRLGGWSLEGYAWLGTGEVDRSPLATAVLKDARRIVGDINSTYVVPRKFVTSAEIDDNSLDDWPKVGETPEEAAATHGPISAGDPDTFIVVGPASRLVVGNKAAYVVFPATLASRSGKAPKATGHLALVLSDSHVVISPSRIPLPPGIKTPAPEVSDGSDWSMEYFAWAPD